MEKINNIFKNKWLPRQLAAAIINYPPLPACSILLLTPHDDDDDDDDGGDDDRRPPPPLEPSCWTPAVTDVRRKTENSDRR